MLASAAFTDCSEPFVAQFCSLQAGRSLSGFAVPRLEHGLNPLLETGLQRRYPEVTAAVYFNRCTHNSCDANTGDKRFGLSSLRADSDGCRFTSNTDVADIDIIIASREI